MLSPLPRIFVQIPSYRDRDCQYTVKDLFEKAAHPERIYVGICWQFMKDKDDECFQIPYPRKKQVRVINVDAKKSRGACWARSLTQTLWKGEEFTLQIDAHMRFEANWDTLLLSMWKKCRNKKAILTGYPYEFPIMKNQYKWLPTMAVYKWSRAGILLLQSVLCYHLSSSPSKPFPGAFISAGFLFASSKIINDVPYDPNLYFFGEEVTLSVRYWTHGYDIYHPNLICIYHDWDRNKRKTHFLDHRKLKIKLNRLSFARVKHILGTKKSTNFEVIKEINIYGLGNKRTLEDYQRYSGVNFRKKTIKSKALKGKY